MEKQKRTASCARLPVILAVAVAFIINPILPAAQRSVPHPIWPALALFGSASHTWRPTNNTARPLIHLTAATC